MSTTRTRSLAGFNFGELNRQFLNRNNAAPDHRAANYGVHIQPINASAEATYWKLLGIYHLAPDENNGRHNAFVEVLDEEGKRIPQRDHLRVGWTWEGKSDGPPQPARLDKPNDEPAADVPIEKGMTLHLWIEGEGPSDRVVGLHTRHADEPGQQNPQGNTYGHHSFYIVFQRTTQPSKTKPENKMPAKSKTEPTMSRFQPNDQLFINGFVNLRRTPGYVNQAGDDVLGQLAHGSSHHRHGWATDRRRADLVARARHDGGKRHRGLDRRRRSTGRGAARGDAARHLARGADSARWQLCRGRAGRQRQRRAGESPSHARSCQQAR